MFKFFVFEQRIKHFCFCMTIVSELKRQLILRFQSVDLSCEVLAVYILIFLVYVHWRFRFVRRTHETVADYCTWVIVAFLYCYYYQIVLRFFPFLREWLGEIVLTYLII